MKSPTGVPGVPSVPTLPDAPLTLAFQTLDYPGDRVVSSIGIYTSVLAEGFVRRGHRVHVVSRSEGPDDVRVQNGVTVHRVGPRRFAIPPALGAARAARVALGGIGGEFVFRQRMARALRRIVAEHAVDLVEACDSGAEALFFRPDRAERPSFVVRLHGPTCVHELFDRNVPEGARRAIRAVERRLALNATHLSTPSTAAREFIGRELALEPGTIRVVPNPPTFDVERPADPAETDPNLVLFVGRIAAAKGVETLARAVDGVLAARPDARFAFVGPDCPSRHSFPSTVAFLRSVIPERHHDRVEFTGYVPHSAVADYLQRAAVCVFPSIFEVFGLVCLEAMSYGKAIVASRNGGMRDLLADGEAGVMFDAGAGDDLAGLVSSLLGDPARRAELGGRARRRALESYALEAVLQETESFYRRCIAERAASSVAAPVRSGASARA